MPPFDIAAFRLNFPEFSDINAYPDAMISFWAAFAADGVSFDRFGSMYSYAVNLYVAHQIKLAYLSSMGGPGGSAGTGLSSGLVSSKAVGSVSVSYNTEFGSQGADAGYYNLTWYGRMLWSLFMRYGAGVVQL